MNNVNLKENLFSLAEKRNFHANQINVSDVNIISRCTIKIFKAGGGGCKGGG